MRKIVFWATMCLFLLLSSQAFASGFSDTKGHWALQEIDECAAVGIINGYPDKTFKPDNSVSHLEALVMIIKSMGLEQQAKELDLTAGSYNFPAGMTWGKEYLALSADRGIISKANMNYLVTGDPTTRAEAAVMIVNALQLKSDGYQLTFADNTQIPGIYKESIAAAVKNGIIVGMPGNKFEPTRTVTRAEMVTIISRVFNKGLINPYPSRYFINKIAGIDKTNQLIALQKSANATQPYLLAEDCLIYKDSKKASLDDFLEEDTVKVVLNNSLRVKYLAHLAADKLPNENPGTGNVPGNTTRKVDGEVIACRNNSITVIEDDDTIKVYEIGPNIKVINSDNVELSMNDLDYGDEVELKLENNKVVFITVDKESTTVTGRVITIKTSGDYEITIFEDEDEKDIKYDVRGNVVVKDGSKTLDFDEIAEGNEVKLYLDSDEDVIKIEITSDDRIITGEVTDIDDRGDYGITIEKLDGKPADYEVEDDVNVREGSRSRDFDDLEEGDMVELSLDEDGLVTGIKILDWRSGSEAGVITYLDLDDYEITLDIDGDETDYELDEDVEIVKDGDELDLDDLIIGSEVEIELDDDLVVKIEVTDDEDIEVEGEIIRVYDDALKIEQKSGSQFTFDFDNRATLEDEDGDDIDIDDLKKGQDVWLQLRDGEIRRLEII
ncbi:S-layer homology domain-containing protein [Desulfolucanica intricata]|uniref:S-layer homology domain-containing protein n=1 Tax=Desulfolucanica intricata TaxID=1285191 RepID=UPI00082B8AA4|nr:S-layer homology domain-containing protein [Desulfolucanica intricata]